MANMSHFFKKMAKGDFDMSKAAAKKKAREAAKKKRKSRFRKVKEVKLY